MLAQRVSLPSFPKSLVHVLFVCITTDIQGRHIRNCYGIITGCGDVFENRTGEKEETKCWSATRYPFLCLAIRIWIYMATIFWGDRLCCANWFKFICKLVFWAPKMPHLLSTSIPFFSLRNAELFSKFVGILFHEDYLWLCYIENILRLFEIIEVPTGGPKAKQITV